MSVITTSSVLTQQAIDMIQISGVISMKKTARSIGYMRVVQEVIEMGFFAKTFQYASGSLWLKFFPGNCRWPEVLRPRPKLYSRDLKKKYVIDIAFSFFGGAAMSQQLLESKSSVESCFWSYLIQLPKSSKVARVASGRIVTQKWKFYRVFFFPMVSITSCGSLLLWI